MIPPFSHRCKDPAAVPKLTCIDTRISSQGSQSRAGDSASLVETRQPEGTARLCARPDRRAETRAAIRVSILGPAHAGGPPCVASFDEEVLHRVEGLLPDTAPPVSRGYSPLHPHVPRP